MLEFHWVYSIEKKKKTFMADLVKIACSTETVLWHFRTAVMCLQFWFHPTTDGSGRGAAIAAAVAERRKQGGQNDKEQIQAEKTEASETEKGVKEGQIQADNDKGKEYAKTWKSNVLWVIKTTKRC